MEATASTKSATAEGVRPFTVDIPDEQTDDLRTRLRRREPDGRPHAGQNPRQHHPLLADAHGDVRRADLLGEPTSCSCRCGGRADATRGLAPRGLHGFPGEIFQAPRSWAERVYPNLTYFNEVEKGGHFAAWEEPELFAGEMRAAFKSLR